jgi:hypothetical protein
VSRTKIEKTKANVDNLRDFIEVITRAIVERETTQKEVLQMLIKQVATLRDQLRRALLIGPDMPIWEDLHNSWSTIDTQRIKNAAITALAALLMGEPINAAGQTEKNKQFDVLNGSITKANETIIRENEILQSRNTDIKEESVEFKRQLRISNQTTTKEINEKTNCTKIKKSHHFKKNIKLS